MNWILTWFQEWRADRIRRANLYNFQKGYRYARGVLRSNMERPVVHLENLVDMARFMKDYNSFDSGIESALEEHAYIKEAGEDPLRA